MLSLTKTYDWFTHNVGFNDCLLWVLLIMILSCEPTYSPLKGEHGPAGHWTKADDILHQVSQKMGRDILQGNGKISLH